MLRDIHRLSSNWLGKIVMGAVMGILIISFGVWGIGDIFRGFGRSTVAKVGGTEITIEQFRQIYTERLQQLGRQIGRPLTQDQARAFGIDRQVLQQIVAETTLNEEAKRLGLAQSDAEIIRQISLDPNFRGLSGNFDPARFGQIIRQAGFTEQRYIAEQRSATLRRQITGTITEGVKPSNTLTEAISRFQNEQRSVSYVTLGAAQAGAIETPSPETLTAYFDDNKAAFRAPEYRKIAVVTVTPASIAKWTDISDADARKAFEERKEKFAKAEKREVSQMMFANADEAKAARDRLVAGTSFADLAKERGLGASDIELGLVTKSAIIDPAIADAAFALPLDEISQPVAGTFGTALVKVTKIEAGTDPTYESVSDEIKRELALERARASVEDMRNKMEDERGGGANVAEAAKKLGLVATTIEAIDRSGRGPDGQPVGGLPEGTDIVAQAFESEVGVETDPISHDGGYIWFEVLGVTPSRDRTFDEVKDQVEARWRADQIAARLRDKAKAMVDKINGGASLASEAGAAGVTVQTAENFKRTDTVTGLSSGAIRAAFRIAKGGAGEADGNGADRIVFQLTEITVPAFDAASEEAKQLQDVLKGMLNDEQITAYVRKIETDIGVSINQGALAQVTGAGQ